MTNRIAFILTLSLSFLFGVDRPKEIETSSQTTTEIQFNTEVFQKNLHIKKEIIQNYKQARKSKSIPKPTGSPIYLSNQKSGNTLIKETPGNKISVDELIKRSDEYRRKINMSERDKEAFAPMGHSQQSKTNRVDYKQKLNELRAQAKAGNTTVTHDVIRKIKLDHQTSTRSRSRSTGTEFEFETIADLYEAFGDVLATVGDGCDGCPYNVENMEEWFVYYFPPFRQDSFEAWASDSLGFTAFYFQFIDENESGEYDDGEIYAVSCEESNISNNKTVAYNGWAFDLDFVDFWMEAYDFDWDSDDEGGPDFSITFDDGTTASYDLHLDDGLLELEEFDGGVYYNVHEATITLSDGTVIEAGGECRDHGAGRVAWDGSMLTSVVYDSDCNNFAFDVMEPNLGGFEDMIEFMSNGGDVDFLSGYYYGFWGEGGTSASASLYLESDPMDDELVDCACDAQYYVGDRVVLTVDIDAENDSLLAGTAGTVYCGGESPWNAPLLVVWDPPNAGNNINEYCQCGDGNDIDMDNSGWWVSCDNIELHDEDYGMVSGVVYDSDGNPVDSSSIYLFSEDGIVAIVSSDSGGFYSAEIPPGHYSAYAFYDNEDLALWGDFWDGGVFHLEESSQMVIDFELYPEDEYAFLIAVAPPMAYVQIEDNNDEIIYEGYTNWWSYAGTTVPPGEYNVHVWVDDQYQVHNEEVEAGQLLFSEFDFGGGDYGWIEGHVWDQDGNGIEDAWVTAWGNSGEWSTNTGPDGYYSLTEVPPGQYEMGAEAEGYLDDGTGFAQVYPNEGTYIDFFLEQEGLGTIHATVYDHEGNPNDSAEVIFFSYENSVHIYVDDNGVASAELSPGPWSVFATDSDTSTWFDTWDGGVTHVEDGSTDNVELFLYPVEEYGYVSIFVRMENNDYSDPIMEVPVTVEDSEGNIHFEGYTHVNGGIGEAMLPGDDYLARVETEYGYQEQYFSVFENSFNFVEFVFGGDPPDPALFGTWMMAPEANALMVGPNPFDGSWWSNTEEDVDTRWCYFDDLYVFDEDGFHNDHDDQTWLEGWQGADSAGGCGFPVYPHDGSSNPAGYDFGGGTLTLHGIGAYIGLPKAVNGFELTSPDQAPESVTYEISFSYDGEIMYLVIEAGDGVFWTFKLIREDDEGDFTFLGEFDGSEYYLSDYVDTWTNANEWLQSWGMPEIHLVTIGSQEENDFLVDVYNEDEFWIGFTDEEIEGIWEWVTGEEVVYTNWFDGEPNNSEGNQHYGISNYAEPGFWDDSENDILRYFIVEVEQTSESATILDVSDVPDDQGGRVYVKFSRSIHDTDSLRTAEMYTVERLDGDTWVGLNSVSAYGNDEYVVEATTLADSTSENDAIMTYRIIAAMEEGNFASDPGSGYSVDNIAPGAPNGVVAVISDGVVYLEWAPSDANDLDYYAVYRSMDPEFLPGEENMIGSSEGSDFADDVEELGDYYYAVTAVDLNGNESDPSELVNVTLLSLEDIHGLPEVFTLHQNYPNPFNPSTQIQYALPTDANVTIAIYDLVGRQIRTLVNQQVSAGYHSVMWNATSDMGSPVSAGVYIYTITANDFRDVKKMILLK